MRRFLNVLMLALGVFAIPSESFACYGGYCGGGYVVVAGGHAGPPPPMAVPRPVAPMPYPGPYAAPYYGGTSVNVGVGWGGGAFGFAFAGARAVTRVAVRVVAPVRRCCRPFAVCRIRARGRC